MSVSESLTLLNPLNHQSIIIICFIKTPSLVPLPFVLNCLFIVIGNKINQNIVQKIHQPLCVGQ